MLSYVLLNGGAWLVRKLTCGAFVPPNYDLAERWVIPPGGIVPTWMRVRAGRPVRVDDVPMRKREPERDSASVDDVHHQKSMSDSADDVKR